MKLTCPQCKTQNEFGRVFCIKCGAKLDFEKAERKLHSQQRRERQGGFWRGIRALLFLGLLAVVGLALWPVKPGGAVGRPEQAVHFRSKVLQLESALAEGRSESADFTEEEVNAHLAQVVQYTQTQNATQDVWDLKLQDINLAFQPDEVVLTVAAVRTPLVLTYEVTGVPASHPQALPVRVTRVRWGHLPLPGPLTDWVTGRIAHIFMNMTRERAVLEHAKCRPVQDNIRLDVSAP